MNVTVALFASAKELFGAKSIEVNLPDSATVAELKLELEKLAPQLGGIVARSMVSINLEFATDEFVIPANAEVALIPPVSGG